MIANAKHIQDSNVHEAAIYFKLGLEVIKTSPPHDDDRVIIFPPYDQITGTDEGVRVKSQLDKTKTMAEFDLCQLEGRVFPPDLVAKRFRYMTQHKDHLYNENEKKGVDLLSKPVSRNEFDLCDRSLSGGSHCDGCSKSKEELQMDEFLKCSRCEMVFYCSAACQRKSWDGGHNKACRKRGQIEIGDDMMLVRLENRKDLNKRFVKVVGHGATEGKWLVKLLDMAQPMAVSGDKLVRLRPKVRGNQGPCFPWGTS